MIPFGSFPAVGYFLMYALIKLVVLFSISLFNSNPVTYWALALMDPVLEHLVLIL